MKAFNKIHGPTEETHSVMKGVLTLLMIKTHGTSIISSSSGSTVVLIDHARSGHNSPVQLPIRELVLPNHPREE